jgi:hypothetical protein
MCYTESITKGETMSTGKQVRIIRQVCKEQGISIKGITYAKGSYPTFSLHADGLDWEVKFAATPSTQPNKQQILGWILKAQSLTQIKLGNVTVKVHTGAWDRSGLLRPGKTPEQMAFEEQWAKRLREADNLQLYQSRG